MKKWVIDHLRETFVHDIYCFLKYTLPDVSKNRLYYNLKLHRYGKIKSYLNSKIFQKNADRPRSIAIDIVSVCNLKCPLCSVPPFITKTDKNFMPLATYQKILDNIDHFVTDLTLVYAGEPFIHSKIGDMLNYTSKNYFVTTITNATLLNKKNIDLIVDNLDYLQISFDGFSKESYEKYRVGADYKKVKNNIINLIKARNGSKSGLPAITITYLINAYNEHEVDECRNFWLSQGADRFYAKYINLNVHRRIDGLKEEDLSHWLPKNKSVSLYDKEDNGIKFKERITPCTTFLSPIIRCDGEILLCCHDIFNTVKIGNILDGRLEDIWNDPKYVNIRKKARERKLSICKQCGK